MKGIIDFLLGRSKELAEEGYDKGDSSLLDDALSVQRAAEKLLLLQRSTGFLSKEQRDHYCARLADRELSLLSDSLLLKLCPNDYGEEITDDHRAFAWNAIYDNYASLDDVRLYEFFADLHRGKYNGT